MNRTLPRPNTKKYNVVIDVLLMIMIIVFLSIAIMFLPFLFWIKLILLFVVLLFFLEFYLRFLGVQIVKCYQHYASEETRRKCLCVPSCSEYAIICFKKKPFIIACFKIRKRLFKTCCGEYKVDKPQKNSLKILICLILEFVCRNYI